MSKYEINTLGKSPIFEEMIFSELENLNKVISRDIMKDLNFLKSVKFDISDDYCLSYQAITKDSLLFEGTILNNELVFLEKEEIEVYFDPSIPLHILDDYPQGLDSDFLEAKEPHLFKQLKMLKLIRKDDIKDIVSLSVKEQIGEKNG